MIADLSGQSSARILLRQFSKELPYPLSNFLSTNTPATLHLFLGYKSPLSLVMIRTEPSSVLRSLSPYCNSPEWSLLTTVQLWFSLSGLSHRATLENSLAIFKMLNIELPQDWAVPLLRHIPMRTEKICPCKNLYRNVHSSSIIQKVKNYKQPKSLSNNEWINKLWYIHKNNNIQQ